MSEQLRNILHKLQSTWLGWANNSQSFLQGHLSKSPNCSAANPMKIFTILFYGHSGNPGMITDCFIHILEEISIVLGRGGGTA